MINGKQQTTAPILTYLFIGTGVAFILLAFTGFIQFKGFEIWANRSMHQHTTILDLNEGWTYQIEGGQSFKVNLPNNLNLPPQTTKITLKNHLPITMIPGGGIRFESMMVAADIYIDGDLVKSYGKIRDVNHFIYNTASNIMFVPLELDQYGKEIVIELTSLFSTELGMIKAPQIGSHHDFLLSDLLNNETNIFLLITIVLFAIILLIFSAIFQPLHDKHLELVAFSLFTFLIAFLYNSQNRLLWEVFNYSTTLPALNEWLFFIIDALLPIFGYYLLTIVTKIRLPKKAYLAMGIHSGLYVVGALLQLTWMLSLNYFRPLFMALTLIFYLFLLFSLKPWKSVGEMRYYQLAVFLIIGAHVADYFKYLLGFLPLSQKALLWLNLEVPFLIFVPLASVIYIILLSYALIFITRKDLGDIKDKAQKDLLTGIYNRATMEDFISAYIGAYKDLAGFIVIDLNHFKSINDTLGHLYGDQVLIQVARKLEIYFGNTDIVARLGGDEFGIFAPNLSHESQIQEKAALAATVLQEIKIDTDLKYLSASVGFSLYPECSSYNQLYESSDVVMYNQKKKYR